MSSHRLSRIMSPPQAPSLSLICSLIPFTTQGDMGTGAGDRAVDVAGGAILQPATCPPERNGEAGILSSVVSPGRMSDPWTVVRASLFSPAPWACRSSVRVLLPCCKSRPCSRRLLGSFIYSSISTHCAQPEGGGWCWGESGGQDTATLPPWSFHSSREGDNTA